MRNLPRDALVVRGGPRSVEGLVPLLRFRHPQVCQQLTGPCPRDRGGGGGGRNGREGGGHMSNTSPPNAAMPVHATADSLTPIHPMGTHSAPLGCSGGLRWPIRGAHAGGKAFPFNVIHAHPSSGYLRGAVTPNPHRTPDSQSREINFPTPYSNFRPLPSQTENNGEH